MKEIQTTITEKKILSKTAKIRGFEIFAKRVKNDDDLYWLTICAISTVKLAYRDFKTKFILVEWKQKNVKCKTPARNISLTLDVNQKYALVK